MRYFVAIFSPGTYERYSRSDRTVMGFNPNHRARAERVQPGDRFVCYLTKASRWIGVLEVLDGPFTDSSPIFASPVDPYTLRFKVRVVSWLKAADTVPVAAPSLWPLLSFTQAHEIGSVGWTTAVRQSLRPMEEGDGALLDRVLSVQAASPVPYEFDQARFERLVEREQHVMGTAGPVVVEVPAREDEEEDGEADGRTGTGGGNVRQGRPSGPQRSQDTEGGREGGDGAGAAPEGRGGALGAETDAGGIGGAPGPETASGGVERTPDPVEHRISHQVQALLAEIGEQLGMRVWIPKADRGAVEDCLRIARGQARGGERLGGTAAGTGATDGAVGVPGTVGRGGLAGMAGSGRVAGGVGAGGVPGGTGASGLATLAGDPDLAELGAAVRGEHGAGARSVPAHRALLDRLPLSYDEATIRIIENIDVLWVRGRAIIRAFEVEHTTSVYSGLLRMADLMAVQPNIRIRSHIVAPDDRREKVMSELRRPVFMLMDGGPLAEKCSFLSYSAVEELHGLPHLEDMKDVVIDRYAEGAEDGGEA